MFEYYLGFSIPVLELAIKVFFPVLGVTHTTFLFLQLPAVRWHGDNSDE